MKNIIAAAALVSCVPAFAGYYTNGDIWTNEGKLPVIVDRNAFTTEENATIDKGIKLFQLGTPIRIVNETNDKMYYDEVCGNTGCGPIYKYVRIRSGSCNDGNSFQPSSYGLVTISLAPHCTNAGYIAGQLGRAVGLRHEHQRPDRDLYVKHYPERVNTINYGAITANEYLGYMAKVAAYFTGMPLVEDVMKHALYVDPLDKARRNFEIGGGTSVGGYDYCSFTHFGLNQFNEQGLTTLEPLQTPACNVYDSNGQLRFVNFTGQRAGLSQGDLATIKAKYANVPPNRPLVYLKRSYSWVNSNTIRFTVDSTGSQPVNGYVTSTNWKITHQPSCQLVSGGSGAPGCLYGTHSYVKEISRTPTQLVFDIVMDRSDPTKVSFTMTDSAGRTMTDTIDVRR